MASNYPPESKGMTKNAANTARQMRQGLSFLFIETIKNSLLRLKTAANAALAARFILNVRNLFLIPLFSTELGFTLPPLPHLPHPLFFNLNLQIHNL